MDRILYQIFNVILSILSKNRKHWLILYQSKIYINKVENRITCTTNTGHYLQLLKSRIMKLLENKENTNIVLVHCQNSRFLYRFVQNKLFGELLELSPSSLVFLYTFNSAFSCVEVWFTDQNSKQQEIEVRINSNFVINWYGYIHVQIDIQLNPEIEWILKAIDFYILPKI